MDGPAARWCTVRVLFGVGRHRRGGTAEALSAKRLPGVHPYHVHLHQMIADVRQTSSHPHPIRMWLQLCMPFVSLLSARSGSRCCRPPPAASGLAHVHELV